MRTKQVVPWCLALALSGACTDPDSPSDDVAVSDDGIDAGVGITDPTDPSAPPSDPTGANRPDHQSDVDDTPDELAPPGIEGVAYGGSVVSDPDARWPGGVVRYRYDSSITGGSYTHAEIEEQLAYLESILPVRFDDIGSSTSGDYVEYMEDYDGSGGVSSTAGMDGGRQTITFHHDPNDATVRHETLHALGMRHEQGRPDRDTWVNVKTDCISDDSQYAKYGNVTATGMYDFRSIMHYKTGALCESPRPSGCTVFFDSDGDGSTENWCTTVVRKNGNPIIPSGDLTREDVNTLWRMYNKTLGADEAGDHFGAAMASGDFDGDGYIDLAIGDPGEDGGAGVVMVYRGTSARLVPWKILRQGDFGWSAEAGDHFGASLAADDVNRDQKADLLIGVPGEDVGSVADAGGAVLAFGGRTGFTAAGTYTQASVGGTDETGDAFGTSVAIGNLTSAPWNRSLIFGAPHERNGNVRSGAAFIYTWDPTAILYGYARNKLYDGAGIDTESFGATLATGDIDGGGVVNEDLAVGAPGKLGKGAVFVYSGRTPNVQAEGVGSSMATWRITLQAPGYSTFEFGAALTVGALRSGTASEEIVVGAPGTESDQGAVYVYETAAFYSPPASQMINLVQVIRQNGSLENGDRFGAAVAVGDLNSATPASDLAVGAPGENGGVGVVSIFDGQIGNATAQTILFNSNNFFGLDEAGDHYGASLCVGNWNGIGESGVSSDNWNDANRRFVDLAIGHPDEAPGLPGLPQTPAGAGAVSIMLGNPAGGSMLPGLEFSESTLVRD